MHNRSLCIASGKAVHTPSVTTPYAALESTAALSTRNNAVYKQPRFPQFVRTSSPAISTAFLNTFPDQMATLYTLSTRPITRDNKVYIHIVERSI